MSRRECLLLAVVVLAYASRPLAFHGRAAAGVGAMSDATADAVHEAARRAVDAWITTGDEKSGRRLRDCLHALSVAGTNRRRPLREGVMPKRRGAARIPGASPVGNGASPSRR